MPKPRKWLARSTIAVALGLGWMSLAGSNVPAQQPIIWSQGEIEARSLGEFRIVPHESGPPTAAERLERRLAALAADVERRRAASGDLGLVEFDVVALNQDIGEVLGSVEDQAEVSVHVRDLETQHVLYDYYGDLPLNPASNQKLLTSSAAIDLLGADYVFETRMVRSGNDLFIIGEGDPTLVMDDLHELAEAVVAKVPLAEIDRLVVDDTAFSAERFGPGYSRGGPGFAYQAPSGALSLNFNSVEVTVYPLAKGSELGVGVYPANRHVELDVRAKVGRRNRLHVRSRETDQKTVVEVSGTLPRRSRPISVRRRISDPGLFAGEALAAILAERTASQPLKVVREHAPPDAEVLVSHTSAPLVEVVDSGLQYSNNFIAEQILRTVAWRTTGDPGDWRNGHAVLEGYWWALGNDPSGLMFENASGLSRVGRVTTTGLVDLISVAHRAHGEHGGLLDALPVAGEAGTMRTRLRFSGKRVRAKTGTLRGVSGLTGVVTSEDGTPQVAFSILINAIEDGTLYASERRSTEDAIVLALLRQLDDYQARLGELASPRRHRTPRR